MSSPRWLPLALFSLSGACALIDEVLWSRAFSVAFGGTHRSEAIVLAVFFAGLAGGSALGARLAAGAGSVLWRRYAACEATVALTAFLPAFLAPLLAAHAPGGVDLVLGLVALVPTVLALGATWPLMVGLVEARGASVGRLYAVTTGGAVAGALLAAFGLVELLGTRGGLIIAACGSAVVAGVSWRLSRGGVEEALPSAVAVATSPGVRGSTRRPWLVGVASGFLVLGLEAVSARLFALRLPHTVYAFGTVVAGQLAGMALGGLLAARVARRPARGAKLLAFLPLAGGIAVVLAPLLARSWSVGQPASLGAELARAAVEVVVLLGPAAVILGALFPLASALLAEATPAEGSAPALGRLAAVNAIAAMLGALVAHFVILPLAGIGGAFAVLALLAGGLSWFAGARGWRAVVLSVILLAVCGGALRFEGTLLGPGERVVETRVGPAATVAVVEGPGGALRLVANARYTLGDSPSWRFHRRLGVLPVLLAAGERRRVLAIGLATGMTAAGARDTLIAARGTAPPPLLEVVELLPEVVELAPAFSEWQQGPLPPVIQGDGRRVLARTDGLDLVLYDLFLPWRPGTANLFTVEAFAQGLEAVGPSGCVAVWVPLYQLSPAGLLLVLETFAAVFPEGRLYAGRLEADRQALLLLSNPAPATTILGRWVQARERGVLEDDPVGDLPPTALELGALSRVVPALGRTFGLITGRVQRDDRPFLEFEGPRARARGELFGADAFRRLVTALDDARDTELEGPLNPTSHAARAAWARPEDALAHLQVALADPTARGIALRVALRDAHQAEQAGRQRLAASLLSAAAKATPDDRRYVLGQRAAASLRALKAFDDADRLVEDLLPEGGALPMSAQPLLLEAVQLALAREDGARALSLLERIPPTHPARPPLELLAYLRTGDKVSARAVWDRQALREGTSLRRALQQMGAWGWVREQLGVD